MLKKYFLSFCTGFLLIFSFPPFAFYPLAWIAFLPLFGAIREIPPSYAFRMGLFSGCVFFLGILYWTVHAMVCYGGVSWPLSLLALFLLVFYLALYFGIFSYFIKIFSIEFSPILIASLWVSLEYIRAHFLTGFPWELLGDSQYNWLSFIQVADIGGVYLLSFLVMWGNASFFQCLKERNKQSYFGLFILGICLGTILFYGQNRLSFWEKQCLISPKKINIGVIQGNIDQNQKWEPAFQATTVKIYEHLSRQAIKNHPELLIWPETALPFYFQEKSPWQEQVLTLARDLKTPILTGSPAYETRAEGIKYFNRAYLINEQGKITGYYDKVHLVPFGEYIPLRKWLPFLSAIAVTVGDFSSGKEIMPLSLTGHYSFGVLICFESIFPELSRELVQKQAHFLVNITNDAWFGRTSAPYQHLAMLVLRAVENRRAIARAANTGFSAFIEPTGKIIKQTKLFEQSYIIANLPLIENKAFYTNHGDILVFFCFCVIFILAIKTVKRGSKWRKLVKF